ncbi:MAG TPA: tetratricopeptide repeat protein, partial [Bryobacteraceae bacterium]|nr:tetratricopeptide repeat protein [Bryobacteraceae bacterium]
WETHVDLAAGHGLRGTLLAREQHKAEAEREYRAAISERELGGDGSALDIESDLWDLAVLYLNERRVADALPLLTRGLEISKASPLSTELRVRILLGLGIAYSAIADRESAERSFQRAVQLVDSVPPAFRSTLGQVLYQAYSAFLKNTGKNQEAKQLRNRGEVLYGRDTSGMTVSFDSLLRRH